VSDNVDNRPVKAEDRSRMWRNDPGPRYWWHRLPDTDFVPSVYASLSKEEWELLREWYAATDGTDMIGECCVPMISFLQGLISGNAIRRIVQLGTCAGYSALLLGFMLRHMGARHGLFTIDIGPHCCEFTRDWLRRAGLSDFVEVAEMHSLDAATRERAREYLGDNPSLVIIDSSHEYGATLQEIDTWYAALAPGGLMALHDVSRFAAEFDVTGQGGVQRAFAEWRKLHPQVEAISLSGDCKAMPATGAYKDACGLGLIYKSMKVDVTGPDLRFSEV
jgi:predicted O-methyltransferase YrrM